MIEGLFVHHDRDRVYHSALSYGKNDKSVFRKRIESVVDEFVNMAEWNHTHSSMNIASRKFDILYDLQSHTRGNRVEILARHPAPIQVSMLIYPGPSGSRWLEYLIADAIVAPPEAAVHYLSKLVYMPDSYQVNFYAKDALNDLRFSKAKIFKFTEAHAHVFRLVVLFKCSA